MDELQIFNNPEFGKIRAVEIDGQPWLVGKDVARALGYGGGKSLANAVANHVDDDDKGVTELMTPGGKQNMVIINESGLYSLVLSSKLPDAKKFKRWVTSEVLPSIRKHGAYVSPQLTDKLDALARRVDQLAGAMPVVTYGRPQPEVSLTGLARVIAVTRRVMLDMGSSPEQVGEVTRSILNTCGFHLPDFKKQTASFFDLIDFF